MSKKNVLCILMVLLMLSAAVGAWAIGPRETASEVEPFEFTLWQPLNPNTPPNNNLPRLVEIEERFGVRVNRTGEEYQDAPEKTNILLASGDIPDVFVVEPVEAAAGVSELFLPLNSYIDDEGKDIRDFLGEHYPLLIKKVTNDAGTVWGVPWFIASFPMVNTWHIRQDWLDKVGLPKPTTIEEVENVLKAFKNQDPANIGKEQIVWVNRWGVRNLARTVNLFGSHPEHYADNGKVVWGPFTENFRQSLIWLNKLYSQGLLDPEFPIRSSSDWESKVAAGQNGFTYANFARIDWFDTVCADLPGADWQALAPVKANIGTPYIYANNGQNFQRVAVISKDIKNPEAVIRWMNYYYTDEGRWINMFGKLGVDYTMKGNQPVYDDRYWNADKDIRYALQDVGIGGDLNNWVPTPQEAVLLRIAQSSPETSEAVNDQEKYLPPNGFILPPIVYTSEENEKIKQWTATMTPVWEEYWVKFITGDLPISRWNDYIDELTKLGMADWVQTIQNAYDRMMK